VAYAGPLTSSKVPPGCGRVNEHAGDFAWQTMILPGAVLYDAPPDNRLNADQQVAKSTGPVLRSEST
jgi:hypothetical protein